VARHANCAITVLIAGEDSWGEAADVRRHEVPLSVDQIMANPGLQAILRELARSFVIMHDASPRMSNVFATQQRWLMAHLALSLYFGDQLDENAPVLNSARFLDAVVEASIASRNTAHAFLQEMLNYRFVRQEVMPDKRFRRIEIEQACLDLVDIWLKAHLETLDQLDGGQRVVRYARVDNGLARLQPRFASAILTSAPVREPDPTFSLFTWLNQGGILMDMMVAGLEDVPHDPGHLLTPIRSAQEMASALGFSRTHLSRKLAEAEKLGSVGWTGPRGRSQLWISPGFLVEYQTYQATKLAIIDVCFDQADL
jgi:hypothetical protein